MANDDIGLRNWRGPLTRARFALSVLAIVLGLCALSGCAYLPAVFAPDPNAPPPDRVTVVQTEEVHVALIPSAPAAPPNDHPAAFTPAQLHVLLMSLRVASKGEGKVTLASPERLKKVAAALSEGLARAGPRQDLKLVFFRTKPSGFLFGSSQRVTTARVFYRDHTLHLIFGELDAFNSPYRDVTIEPHVPGERDKPTDVNGTRLVANSAWRWHGGRRDWIEMGATAEAIAQAAEAAPRVISVGSSGSARPLAYGPAAGNTGSESVAKQAPAEPGSGADHGIAPAAPAAGGAWDKLEKRLTMLKRLYQQGLITKQDYEAKKAELLQELP